MYMSISAFVGMATPKYSALTERFYYADVLI